MKKRIIITFVGVLALFSNPLCASEQYSISLYMGYGHNLTYGSFANFDLGAYMPLNTHFEMQANVRMSTANTYAVGVQMRPKFALPVGEMYIEDRLLTSFIRREQFLDFVHALSVGYRMQYVNVQLGMTNRVMLPPTYELSSGDTFVCEPFDLLYRLEVYVRPATSVWNLSMALANVDEYQIERMWQPMFYLGGWYDIDDHWRLSLNGKLKLAGMFHLNAHYYASEVRVGAEYKF
jgi:hypothetical protein